MIDTPFALADIKYREESERVSELKSISGSESLPAGMLANGAEGIKEAIQGFDDACVAHLFCQLLS